MTKLDPTSVFTEEDALEALSAMEDTSWQVHDFAHNCTTVAKYVFGDANVSSQRERLFRFFEESVELVQAGDMTEEEAHAMVTAMYARPKGEFMQELAGMFNTSCTLAVSHAANMAELSVKDWLRVLDKKNIERCRAKNDDPHKLR